MPPKRASTSEAPTMTQAAIRKRVADSVTAALEAQAATMANTNNPNRNTGPTRIHVVKTRNYKEFISCQPFYFNVLCPNMVPNTEKLLEAFIGGLPRSIEGNVTASKPQTLEEAINISQRLMDQVTKHSPVSFDIVIGMDWLSKNHAKILYDEKVVHIPINGETLNIRVMEKKSDEKRLEDIPIVKEFPNIFPEHLFGLPPKTKNYIWDEEQESAFQLLKQKLCEAPILALPKGNNDFVVYCDASLQECQKPSDLLVQLENPMWKWERITMDFITKLPKTSNGHDTIWIIVDRLTKSAHFIPTQATDSMETLTRLYIKEIVYRHGVPISIISDRDRHFTSRFWQSLQNALGT
nr:reverse transcriptase domain-containing protein [Tanacetum cinerariifolium]